MIALAKKSEFQRFQKLSVNFFVINIDLRVWTKQPQRQLPVLHRGRGRRLRARQEVPLSRLLHGQQENGQTGLNPIKLTML